MDGEREAAMAGYIEGKDQLLKRLRRIEGQVRGLQRMVESETYCIDVLTQISAATKALQAVALGAARGPPGALRGRRQPARAAPSPRPRSRKPPRRSPASSAPDPRTTYTGRAHDHHDLPVSGMTCGHCVSAVTEEIGKLDGVTGVEVDLVAGGTSRFRGQHDSDPDAAVARRRRRGRLRPGGRPAMTPGQPDPHEARSRPNSTLRTVELHDRRHDLRVLRGPDREEAQPDADGVRRR